MNIASRIANQFRMSSLFVRRNWYLVLNLLFTVRANWGMKSTFVLGGFLFVASLGLAGSFQKLLVSAFRGDPTFASLRSLFGNLGMAMIGASAIVSSLVLFSTQVNVQRLPHGMFVRVSSDRKLISAFAMSFLLSISIAAASLVQVPGRISIATLLVCWALIVVLGMFFFSYRRALHLINPVNQIAAISMDAGNDLMLWEKRADRFVSMEPSPEANNTCDIGARTSHDFKRIGFFARFPKWTQKARMTIGSALSLASRAAEEGEYDISRASLAALCWVNRGYVHVKGKTFFAIQPLFDFPMASDAFVTETLEGVRRFGRAGIVSLDEERIRQAMATFAALADVYIEIDYSQEHVQKSHSHLSMSYLCNLLEEVPKNMPDVSMEGCRLIGKRGQNLISVGSVDLISQLSGAIAQVALAGIRNDSSGPVAREGITQLSNLTLKLIGTTGPDIRFPMSAILANLKALSLEAVRTPRSLDSVGFVLGPFYSSTSMDSFQGHLSALINRVIDEAEDDRQAFRILSNLKAWAKDLHDVDEELYRTSVHLSSMFTICMVQWISAISELLLAASNAPACDGALKRELRAIAVRKIRTLTSIPEGFETTVHVENSGLTQTLFKAAHDALSRGCQHEAIQMQQVLLDWTIRASRNQDPHGILAKGLTYLSVLALLLGSEAVQQVLETTQPRFFALPIHPDEASRTSRFLRETAESIGGYGMPHYDFDIVCSLVDPADLRPLLLAWAGIFDSTES